MQSIKTKTSFLAAAFFVKFYFKRIFIVITSAMFLCHLLITIGACDKEAEIDKLHSVFSQKISHWLRFVNRSWVDNCYKYFYDSDDVISYLEIGARQLRNGNYGSVFVLQVHAICCVTCRSFRLGKTSIITLKCNWLWHTRLTRHCLIVNTFDSRVHESILKIVWRNNKIFAVSDILILEFIADYSRSR